MTIDDSTFQLIVKLFAGLVSIIMLVVLVSLFLIIYRDGNTPQVQNAFNDMVSLGQWVLGIIGAVFVVRPVTNAFQKSMEARANYLNANASIKQAQAQKVSEASAEQVVSNLPSPSGTSTGPTN